MGIVPLHWQRVGGNVLAKSVVYYFLSYVDIDSADHNGEKQFLYIKCISSKLYIF